MSLGLIIQCLTVEDVKEILRLLREMGQKDPTRVILCCMTGLEGKSLEEAKKTMLDVLPKTGVAA